MTETRRRLGTHTATRARLAREAQYAPAHAAPEARPTVSSEGSELEVVWFPHRNAQSLLEDRKELKREALNRGRQTGASRKS